MPQQLPNSDQLDIATLSGLFKHTANSYKYLFFISLLTLLKDRHFQVDDGIKLSDIEIEMLITAWYPRVSFKLSFGTRDQIARALKSINCIKYDKDFLSVTGRGKLRKRLVNSDKKPNYKLMRYVPHRILRPFFAAETSGLPDQKVNRKVSELATKHFHERRPLFRFDDSEERILLQSDWIAYLKQNQGIIEGWAMWHWADYMQQRNPGIPAVTRKLLPPDKRESLNAQRSFWNMSINKADIRCIYSGKKLGRSYELDHFLPWRFVAHDQLWNLIPADSHANSSKSDQIPCEKYIDGLAETQSTSLSIARDSMSDEKWKKVVEPYTTDLFICADQTLDHEELKSAYHKTLIPLMSIAKQQGFGREWTYETACTGE